MEILITILRKPTTPTYTEGLLLFRSLWFGYTMEDTVRDLAGGEPKVHGLTAIPAGIYRIGLEPMAHRNKPEEKFVRIYGVPTHDEIFIHGGNAAKDSNGCPLICSNWVSPGVIQGALAFPLAEKVRQAFSKSPGPFGVEIRDAAPHRTFTT